ncbi:uncharacterized protein LOC130977302 [Arachis stenosperma]|uniref:uncharacterized protein LOC130977302 n=1 Tax=Arachis stenosperma TaxID=217475 RepID=UPI0025ACE5B1|nr:uncharacterized protein LOC130977302 [Arachis stenosperma]
MVNKYGIEALDRTMRDILRFNNSRSEEQPFGGKTIVFGGDFRQILPVIPKETRQEIVNAIINSSYIWNSCKLMTLMKNMRLEGANGNQSCRELKEFADWILSIGDGRCGRSMDGADNVEIPDDILIKEWDDPIVAICREIYPEMMSGMNCDMQVEDRAILATTLELVDEINRYMKSLNPTEAQTYFSSGKACPTENNNDILASVHILELLNTIRCSGVQTTT